MSLLALYDLSLQGRRDTPALDVRGPTGEWHTFTFADLDLRSNRWAHVLAARGVNAGDRVAFCLPNRAAVIDLWLAVVKLGAIAVPINVLYRGREIAHILGDAAPSAVVTTPDRAQDFEASCACWTVEALEAEASTAPEHRPAAHTGAATPVALIYTSGTTGVAKGAVLTHGNFAANALSLLTAWCITSADR